MKKINMIRVQYDLERIAEINKIKALKILNVFKTNNHSLANHIDSEIVYLKKAQLSLFGQAVREQEVWD